MNWDDKHPCPYCGKEHEEREMLNRCTNCGQVYCNNHNCGDQLRCPRCGSGGVTPFPWNPISRSW